MKMLNKLKYETTVTILLIVSIITVLFNDVLYGKWKLIFTYNEIIHNLISNFSIGYILSWIFYYLVVVLKEKREKSKIYISACYNTSALVQRAQMIFYLLVEGSNNNSSFRALTAESVTSDQFHSLCITVGPNSLLPQRSINLTTPANVIQMIQLNCIDNVQYYINILFTTAGSLEAEHVRLLNTIRDDSFFKNQFIFMMPLRNPDFTTLEGEMYNYLTKINKLKTYNDLLRVKYKIK